MSSTTMSFANPVDACDFVYSDMVWPNLVQYYRPDQSFFSSPTRFECGFDNPRMPTFGSITSSKVDCADGQTFDYAQGDCGFYAQKGSPSSHLACSAPSPEQGNPINSSSGNKFQAELDYSDANLQFWRFYNGSDGYWRHSYSERLEFFEDFVTLVLSDGRQSRFDLEGGGYTSAENNGHLEKGAHSWLYISNSNESYVFSENGRLQSYTPTNGRTHSLVYNSDGFVVDAGFGSVLQVSEDKAHQPRVVTGSGISIKYIFQDYRLKTVVKDINGKQTTRSYHYEDSRFPDLLTGITNESGIRYVTWTYDANRRALSSEHSGGTNRNNFSYYSDGVSRFELKSATTVINEFNKAVIYQFELINGVKRITSIRGEPTPDCPASNSSYTYNDRGQVLTKTDAKGLVTSYTYNDRGLETSRTEASGTPLARTTTTEWDLTRFLPVRIVEPDRTTVYSYDTQGRELSRQTTSH